MTSPVPSTASRPSTWWRVTPYFTARMPPALVATLPPRLALVLAREHRVHEPVRRGRLVELVERDAGLHDRDVVLEVDLEDRVHALERHDDAAVDAGCTRRRGRCPMPRAVTGTPALVGELARRARPRRSSPGRTTASGRCGDRGRAPRRGCSRRRSRHRSRRRRAPTTSVSASTMSDIRLLLPSLCHERARLAGRARWSHATRPSSPHAISGRRARRGVGRA